MVVVDGVVPAIRELKRIKPEPKKLSVKLLDGTEETIVVPPKRNRWQSVSNIVKGLQWESIAGYDGRGNILGGVMLDPEQIEDVEPSASEVDPMLATILKAQELVLKFNGNHQERLLKAAVDMVEAATQRTASLEQTVSRLTKQQERLQAQLLRAAEEAEDGEMGDMVKVLLANAALGKVPTQ